MSVRPRATDAHPAARKAAPARAGRPDRAPKGGPGARNSGRGESAAATPRADAAPRAASPATRGEWERNTRLTPWETAKRTGTAATAAKRPMRENEGFSK